MMLTTLLRRKSLPKPVIIFEFGPHPVVEPRGASLPKFELIGNEAVAAPMWRARNTGFVFEAVTDIIHLTIEKGTVRNDIRLWRGPSTNLGSAGAGCKILV